MKGIACSFAVLVGVFALVGCDRSAANGGPEDPAIRSVEGVGGVCRRVSDLKGEGAPGRSNSTMAPC